MLLEGVKGQGEVTLAVAVAKVDAVFSLFQAVIAAWREMCRTGGIIRHQIPDNRN